ncbi:hypothetical protein O1611_g5573 [Lasiodiplodia mahajangana]|uniref:Uncharacterized protein n=1 Tax=Lasiodiplodia mahajangana TaxID=1108764 RepID=A0ACC2JKW8_9PEZI|nr:hypothetical protein O1611_g5573 [Lasiodiplodia mahajangana]
MACDIRPVMPLPSNPGIRVVDPYVVPQALCYVVNSTVFSSKSGGKKCPLHPCSTSDIPPQGVWRKIESLDDIVPAIEDSQRMENILESDMLRVARRGRISTVQQVVPIIDKLEAAMDRYQRASQGLKGGGPIQEYQAANAALEPLVDEATSLQISLETWANITGKAGLIVKVD